MPDIEPLFSPLQIGKLQVAGRVFKTATAETRADKDGFVTDELLEFYAPIADAGTPLIITGNIFINVPGKSTHRMTGADDDDKIPGLRRLADTAHAGGSKLFAQLNHCGRQVLAGAMGLDSAVSASDVREKMLGTKPRPMTPGEIRKTVSDFAAAAVRCQKAGFDGVQIHAGHGYLICQFLTPYTNRRRDEYGGSFENRVRFLREVVRETRARVGADFPIILKLNGADALPARKGLKTPELVHIAKEMEAEGVDGIEVTVGHYESGFPMIRGTFDAFFDSLVNHGLGPEQPQPMRFAIRAFGPLLAFVFNRIWPHYEGFNLDYSRALKAELSIPIICVGGFRSRSAMHDAITSDSADAVSCARSFVADPYFYEHLRTGEPGPKCTFCNACIGRAGKHPVDCYHPVVRSAKDQLLAKKDVLRSQRPPSNHPAANGTAASN